jgi:hypothetical protein
MERCANCHWWSNFLPSESDRRPCIFHNGMKGEKVAKIEFGGNKTLRTSADFGCTAWEKDRREKQCDSLDS